MRKASDFTVDALKMMFASMPRLCHVNMSECTQLNDECVDVLTRT